MTDKLAIAQQQSDIALIQRDLSHMTKTIDNLDKNHSEFMKQLDKIETSYTLIASKLENYGDRQAEIKAKQENMDKQVDLVKTDINSMRDQIKGFSFAFKAIVIIVGIVQTILAIALALLKLNN